MRIVAIDNPSCGGSYDITVDLVINQYNLEFWRSSTKHIIARAGERTLPTIVLLRHEYGHDPDEKGNDGRGRNVVDMIKTFREQGLITLIYLHTVLENLEVCNA